MTRNRILGFVALLLVVVVGATSALGQGFTTGSITGNVENENTALPGVTVTLKSPNLQGTRTTVTAGGGNFTFSGLRPARTPPRSRFRASRRSRRRSRSRPASPLPST